MAQTLLFVGRDEGGNGADMAAVTRGRGLVVAILVIAMLAAVPFVACAGSVHLLPTVDRVGACLTMSHSTVLRAAASSEVYRVPAPTILAVMAAPAISIFAGRMTHARTLRSTTPGMRIDPLNGRLRL